MGVETFAALDGMRDLQRFFLGAIALSRFDFVGITERFGESVERFNAAFGTDLHRTVTVNANPDKPAADYRAMVGSRVYDTIADLNARDMSLYEEALSTIG
jgi:hypothetical protein